MGRLVFMGSPEFALPGLEALLADGHEIALVLSRPEQPAGRGRGMKSTAVAAFARERGLPLETPARLRDGALRERLAALEADLFAVVAYRILPPALLEVPRLGSINLHGSLLPDYRGAAPIERALMDGATRTGLTTFLLERGVDTGRILEQVETPVGEDETAGELRARLMILGAPLLARSVREVLEGRHRPQPQPEGSFPPAPKLSPADRGLDFALGARVLHNRIRALAPEPGALALFRGLPLQVLRTRVEREAGGGEPGRLRKQGGRLFAACGAGELEILELAAAGRKHLAAAAWLAGARLGEHEHLERVPAGSATQPGDAA